MKETVYLGWIKEYIGNYVTVPLNERGKMILSSLSIDTSKDIMNIKKQLADKGYTADIFLITHSVSDGSMEIWKQVRYKLLNEGEI